MFFKRTALALAIAAASASSSMTASAQTADSPTVIPAGDATPVPSQTPPTVLLDQATVYATQAQKQVELRLTGLPTSAEGQEIQTSVLLIRPDGTSARVAVSPEGSVLVDDVKAGLHAAFVLSPIGHAAIPFVVREESGDADDNVAAPAVITIPAFQLSMGMVNRAVNSFLPPFAEKDWAESLNRSLLETGKVIPTHRYQVHLNAQGEMEGQIFPLLVPEVFSRKVGGTNILIHRDGEVVARTLSDESGRFIVKDLKPGHYGLVAAGVVGYAAFAFDAVEGDITTELSKSTTTGNSLYTLVSTARSANAAETLIAAVSQGSILPVAPIPSGLVPGDMFATPMEGCTDCGMPIEEGCETCGGIAGGCGAPSSGVGHGGGGGGGMGGGIGGIGSLLGLAGLVGLAGIDDGNKVVPLPVTLATP
jgi:hypothetical protein